MRLANEIKTFVWHNGRPQGMRSYNDDLVIATAIGCWVRDTAMTVNKRELEYKKAMIRGMLVTKKTLETKIDGMHGYKQKRPARDLAEDSNGNKYDISWIIKG